MRDALCSPEVIKLSFLSILFFFAVSSAFAKTEVYPLTEWMREKVDLQIPAVIEKKYAKKEVRLDYKPKIKILRFSFTPFANLIVDVPETFSDLQIKESIRESLAKEIVQRSFNYDFKTALSRISFLQSIQINDLKGTVNKIAMPDAVRTFVLHKLLKEGPKGTQFLNDLELWWRLRWNPPQNPVLQNKVALLVGKVDGLLPRLRLKVYKSIAQKFDFGHSVMGLIRLDEDLADNHYMNPGSNPTPGDKVKMLSFLFGFKPHIPNSIVVTPFWNRLYYDTEVSHVSTMFNVIFPTQDQVRALYSIVRSKDVPLGIFALLYRNCSFGTRDLLNSILPLDAELPFSGITLTLPGLVYRESRVLFHSSGRSLVATPSDPVYEFLPAAWKGYDFKEHLPDPETWSVYQDFMSALRKDQQTVPL